METEIIKRIKAVQSCKTKSVNQFAIEIGCKQNTISNQLNEKRALSLDTVISVISSYPDISPDWLLLGKGDMLRKAEGTAYTFNNNKAEGGSAIGVGNTVSADAQELARLREENKTLRERCDKLTDKLLNTL